MSTAQIDILEKVLMVLFSAGAGAVIGFLAGYFKKLGENLATKHDFDEIKGQTADLTEATKKIEAKIDDEIWDRQKQWEMRRDILLEIMRSMADIRNAHYGVTAAFKGAKKAPTDKQAEWIAIKANAVEAWRIATEKLELSRITAEVLGDTALIEALKGFRTSVRLAYGALTMNAPEEQFERLMTNVNGYDTETLAAARDALGIEKT
jgi:hypothetical protein